MYYAKFSQSIVIVVVQPCQSEEQPELSEVTVRSPNYTFSEYPTVESLAKLKPTTNQPFTLSRTALWYSQIVSVLEAPVSGVCLVMLPNLMYALSVDLPTCS